MGKNSKDKRDLYYRKAKEEGWRARSAFKLLQLNEQFGLFQNITKVVDLCAAPGSWSQVLAYQLFEVQQVPNAKIVAVDLQPMVPIPHVIDIQADITHPKTLQSIIHVFDGSKADFVCSDGAPDVTGLHDLDEYLQAQLVLSALQLATCILQPGGTFVAKIFRGRDIDLLYSQLSCLFTTVVCAKPRSSRGLSLEAFVVCRDYQPPQGWIPELKLNQSTQEFFETLNKDELLPKKAKFVACGDLNEPDSDATYTLDAQRITLAPVQMPTAPPYKEALEMKRKGELQKH